MTRCIASFVVAVSLAAVLAIAGCGRSSGSSDSKPDDLLGP